MKAEINLNRCLNLHWFM